MIESVWWFLLSLPFWHGCQNFCIWDKNIVNVCYKNVTLMPPHTRKMLDCNSPMQFEIQGDLSSYTTRLDFDITGKKINFIFSHGTGHFLTELGRTVEYHRKCKPQYILQQKM